MRIVAFFVLAVLAIAWFGAGGKWEDGWSAAPNAVITATARAGVRDCAEIRAQAHTRRKTEFRVRCDGRQGRRYWLVWTGGDGGIRARASGPYTLAQLEAASD